MKRTAPVVVVWIACGIACAADPPDDKDLIHNAPPPPPGLAQPPPASAPAAGAPGTGADWSSEERAARTDANFALARLQLVLARKALRSGDLKAAARHAQQVKIYVRQLPTGVDASETELQAEGILARAAKAGVNIDSAERDAAAEAPRGRPDRKVDRAVDGAARVARQYEGPPRSDMDTSGDARTLRERTLRRRQGDQHAYRPGRDLVDVRRILATDSQRLIYEGALDEAVSSDEMRVLVNAEEARLVPDRDVAYPADWPERVARRQQWAGGVVARSPSWYDKDGREWYVAIYDIRDLTYVPPDFGIAAYSRWSLNGPQDALDRQAVREGFFSGWGGYHPWDALPLLRYFGGLNPWVDRGPKYSAEKQEEIVNMIRAFTGGRVEPAPVPALPVAPPPSPGN